MIHIQLSREMLTECLTAMKSNYWTLSGIGLQVSVKGAIEDLENALGQKEELRLPSEEARKFFQLGHNEGVASYRQFMAAEAGKTPQNAAEKHGGHGSASLTASPTDPCHLCPKGVICRTPACGRLVGTLPAPFPLSP